MIVYALFRTPLYDTDLSNFADLIDVYDNPEKPEMIAEQSNDSTDRYEYYVEEFEVLK